MVFTGYKFNIHIRQNTHILVLFMKYIVGGKGACV